MPDEIHRNGSTHLRGGVDALGMEPLLALVALHKVSRRLRIVWLLAQAEQLLRSRSILLLNLPLLLHRSLRPGLLHKARSSKLIRLTQQYIWPSRHSLLCGVHA